MGYQFTLTFNVDTEEEYEQWLSDIEEFDANGAFPYGCSVQTSINFTV